MTAVRSDVSAHGGSPSMRSLFATRRLSMQLAEPLSPEDQTVQAMDDASPTKWHLAHTTWFFETFVLARFLSGYRLFDSRYGFCFNSYYESEGPRQARARRGHLSRPSCDEIHDYRRHVDAALLRLAATGQVEENADIADLVAIGVQHEQQHQELMLTDILALFARNPLRPVYAERSPRTIHESRAAPTRWLSFEGGVMAIGSDAAAFAWDNERPRHQALIHPFRLCDRLVTNAEWLAFMQAGGYRTPALWLADGWATVRRRNWSAPAYFEEQDGRWMQMTLGGLLPLDAEAPVAHVSFYEADAFARWAGKRLPTEFEWEVAAVHADAAANDLASGLLSPRRAPQGNGLLQMYGDVWEWTASAYLPYPGYRIPDGAVGEYNGKFMSGQMVLRGGSCVTPAGHVRAAYRNFFYPRQRWQFCGLRLAEDAL